ALAGQNPDNLEVLETAITDTITETIASPASNITTGLEMMSKKSLLVSSAGDNIFHYDLSPESLDYLSCSGQHICYDCLYNLEITITDDCNNQKLGGAPKKIIKNNFSIGSIDTTCAKAAVGFTVDTTIYLEKGNYEITKKLTISRYGADYYRDSVFMLRNFCKSLNEFIELQKAVFLADGGDCKPTCTGCLANIGSRDSFLVQYYRGAGIATKDTANYSSLAASAYTEAVEECNALCTDKTELDIIRRSMLDDIAAPTGQYAQLESDTAHVDEVSEDIDDKYSIFYTEIQENNPDADGDFDDASLDVVIKAPAYQDSNIVFYNNLGEIDSVYNSITGTVTLPNDLGPDDFAGNFSDTWTESLLPYHPEYCKLKSLEKHKGSYVWDKDMDNTDTYAEAFAKGYLNPLQNDPLVGDTIGKHNIHFYSDKIKNKIDLYKGTRYSSGMSLASFACMITMCDSLHDYTDHSGVNSVGMNDACVATWKQHAFDTTLMCKGDLDKAWKIYRTLYIEEKRIILVGEANEGCPANESPYVFSATSSPTAKQLWDAKHTPNIFTAEEAIQNSSLSDLLNTDKNGAQNERANAAKTAGVSFDSTCHAYAYTRVQELAPCNYSDYDRESLTSQTNVSEKKLKVFTIPI
ncbi:MAG: hypothetical protein HY305_06665, partial [Sphingobacteriales bacterium]|nr:hypothetical protein [Sphingobacteriales bacterium]